MKTLLPPTNSTYCTEKKSEKEVNFLTLLFFFASRFNGQNSLRGQICKHVIKFTQKKKSLFLSVLCFIHNNSLFLFLFAF